MSERLSGMGGHQSARMKKDEWLTPPEILKALGPFDLDPCAPYPHLRPWPMAEKHYSANGLSLPWEGRVWLNPPYGLYATRWLNKLASHGNGIALIFARTETTMFFHEVWGKADAVFFFKGRLFFHHLDGSRARANAGAPSCLIAYGMGNVESIKRSGLKGKLICL